MAIYKGNIVYLSKYCGEDKVRILKHMEDLFPIIRAGFNDLSAGMNNPEAANLRKQNGKIYVLDTAKDSFKGAVHQEIDAFERVHDEIQEALLQ